MSYKREYRDLLERAHRKTENDRMTMKHERRLLKMREQGVKVK